MSFLKKLFDQVNPFDGGKTWSNPNPVRPQPAQTPPPSYGGGVRGVTNWARDKVDANTPQDRWKRQQAKKPVVVPTAQDAVRKNLNQLSSDINGANNSINNFGNKYVAPVAKVATAPIAANIDGGKALVGQLTGNQQARNNALGQLKNNSLAVPKVAYNTLINPAVKTGQAIGENAATAFSGDAKRAEQAQTLLTDQLESQKLNVYKQAKNGFQSQGQVDRFNKYADNLWNDAGQARANQINAQQEKYQKIDPVKNAALIADAGLTAVSFGVGGVTKQTMKSAATKATEKALTKGLSKDVAMGLGGKAARNNFIGNTLQTGTLGAVQGGISPYATQAPGTVKGSDVFKGALMGGTAGAVLPAAFVKAGGGKLNLRPQARATADEVLNLSKFRSQMGGMIDPEVYKKGVATAQKFGIDHGTPEGKAQIDNVIGSHRTFENNQPAPRLQPLAQQGSINPVQAFKDIRDKLNGSALDTTVKPATPENVYGINALEKLGKKLKLSQDGGIPNPAYRSAHQIDNTTSRNLADLTSVDDIVGQVKSKYGLTNYDQKDITNLKKIIGNPEVDVKIYRASPVNEINSGDWVTTSKQYANDIKRQNGGKVYEHTVKAKDLNLPANIEDNPSLARFSAFQYNQATKPKPNIINRALGLNDSSQGGFAKLPGKGAPESKLVTRYTPGKDLGDGKYQMAKAELLDENGKVLEAHSFSREPNLNNPLDKRNVEEMRKELAREYINRKHFNDPKNQMNTGWYKGTDKNTPTEVVAPKGAPIEKTPTVSKVTGNPSTLLSNAKPVSKVTGKPSQLLAPNKVAEEATPPLTSEMGTQKTLQTQSNPIQETGMVDGSASSKTPVQEQGQPLKPTQKAEKIGSNTYTDSKQQRGFKSNIAKDTETPLTVYKDIPGYNVKPNAKTIGSAAQRVAKDPEGTYNRLLENGIQNTEDSADALVTLRNLVENDELDKASKLAKATAKAGTDFGQAVQIFSAFRKTTPDGALRDAWNIINNYNVKNPKKAPIRITSEQTKKITSLANDLQKTEYGTREWAVKAAQLEKEKGLLVPTSFLSKISTVQTMAQLLNPKTAIRNVVGNTVLDILEDVVRLPATAVDATLKSLHIIDSRNMVIPNMKSNWLNKYTGFKQGVEDVNLGIRTKGATGNYDIMKEVFKPGTVGNKLEKALGYELASMDKAFYTGRYQSSLENMMKAQKAKVPTPEMKSTAEAEALYATFQNNSNIAKVLTKSKNAMNVGKEWGVGDFILKYPKTPGNIVNVGLDYSPVGFVKGLKSLHDGIKLGTMGDVRNGELLLGRGLVGSGLILGGAFLAKQGIITGKTDSDPDKREADKMTGQGPFSFNVTALGRLLKGEDTKTQPGDVTANYDWLQPNAIQLSMGANMVINNGKADKQLGDGLDALGSGVDTISEQPVFSGVKQFFGNMNTQNGGGIGKATQGLASGIPASFTPSILNQAGQQLDNTKRSTYDPAPVTESWNKVKARLPGLRNTLLPAQNTLGQDMKQYDVGGNNPFNVFFNPSFLNRVSDSPTMQLVDGLNKSTGETSQYPRTVGKKQTFDGVKTQLSAQGLYDMKKGIGGQTDKLFTEFSKDPAFNALSDTDKVKALQGTLTDINASEKAKYSANNSLGQFDPNFTGKAGTLTKNQKSLINGDYNTSALASGMDIPKGLSQSATKILTSYSKDKANEPNNDPEVKTALKAWAGEDVPVNNETAKLWAEYEKDRVSNKLSPLEVDKRKKAVLKTAYSSGLNDFEKKYYSAADDDIIGALQKGDITEESLRKAMSVDANLVAKGVIKSSGFGKKVWNALGMSVPSVKGSVASGGKKSSGRKSSGKKSSGRKTAKSTKTNIYSLSKVNSRTKSTNNALRKLLGAAKI